MRNLFIGGSSEIAKSTAIKLRNVDNLGRHSSKVYKKNYIIKSYSRKNINNIFKKLKYKYKNLVIFNGKYSNSFLTNFEEKDFYNVLKINFVIPLMLATIAIERKIIEKKGSINFISSIASQKNQKGNAYYSITKNALYLLQK